MTAPSQTPEAAGLEVVAWRSIWTGLTGRVVHALHDQKAEAIRNAKWMEDAAFEPLVTAASAQARIAELSAKVAELEAAKWEVKHVDTMNDMVAMGLARDAEKARADGLAKALERIEGYDWPVIVGHDVQTSVGQATGAVYENRFPIAKETALSAFNQVKAIARAALQQETQP